MKSMKRVAWVFGGVVALLVVAAATIPLFVDVDRYRPVILEKANAMLDGKLAWEN